MQPEPGTVLLHVEPVKENDVLSEVGLLEQSGCAGEMEVDLVAEPIALVTTRATV
jgi:hypothetical protein